MNNSSNAASDMKTIAHQRYAITVDFIIKEEYLADFMKRVQENAIASVRDEPQCYRFDILTPTDTHQNHVFLYEIYETLEAFEHHLTTQHFKLFDQATAHMVVAKTPHGFLVTENAKGSP